MSLRILHICKVFLPQQGGIQKVVSNIVSQLCDFSHTILTTHPLNDVIEKKDTTPIHRCKAYREIASLPISASLVTRARKLSKQHDLIAVHYPFPLCDLTISTLLSPPPIVVHWHSNIVAQSKLKWLVMPITLMMLFRARAIVVTSPRIVNASSFLKLFSKKIQYISYGIDALPTIEKNSNGPEQPYFLTIARHVSYKALHTAIEAVSLCQNSILVMIGDGPLIDKHIELADSLGVNDRIQFIRNADEDEATQRLNNAIALILPSNMPNEAFGIVQLEAMRLAIPVINTDIDSAVPMIARNNKEALTVPADSPHSLAEAMQKLQTDPELVKRLGNNGHERFLELYTSELFKDNIQTLYEQIFRDYS